MAASDGGQALEVNALLGLDNAAFPTAGSGFDAIEIPQGACPSHPGADNCICHGLMSDWPLEPNASITQLALDEPDYSQFENWIPRFIRPVKPCDYCKSKRLDCFLTRGETTCNPCRSLFRCCSLKNSNTLESTNYVDKHSGTFLDTLHAVDENAAKEQGTFTGVKPLRSKTGHGSGTSTPVRPDDAPGSLKRNGIRFPRHAVKTLRDWLDTHVEHPYPTEEEKIELERRTDLQPSQISNWLANARRRKKAIERPRAHMSPSLRPTTPALPIPGALDKPWEELNPIERWQHSPPEHEPAALTDIANALAHTDPLDDSESTSPSSAGRRKRSSNGSAFTSHRALSATSIDTSGARTSSKSASSAAFSQGSSHSHGSFGSFNSSLAGKRDRRRRRRPAPATTRKKSGDDKKRIFQCTFCTDTFTSKYDWTRHEKSLHLSLEKWICHPIGPIIAEQGTNIKKCVYCGVADPTDDHIETHNHRQCEDKGLDARTFYRKDHLRQHLRLMHSCEMTSFMELWKSTAVNINSRCGFCAQRFSVWQERIDHITAHFKAGVRMSEWKGCRGLDPAVAAKVTNAMPPYLIGIEAVSPMPFSATNRSSWRTLQGDKEEKMAKARPVSPNKQVLESHMGNTEYGTKATCWEILTVRLGKYANEMAQKGVVLTDEMLQRQARRVLYESDDTWNQTAADNPEWLDLFKKAHGLDFIPSDVGGQGVEIPEDLETYGDLGLRIPFAVQLQAYNMNQAEARTPHDGISPKQYQDAVHGTPHHGVSPKQYQDAVHGRAHFRDFFAQMHKEGRLHDKDFVCGHEECAQNKADISWLDDIGSGSSGRFKRWCARELPLNLLKPVAFSTSAEREPMLGDTWGDVSKDLESRLSPQFKQWWLGSSLKQLNQADVEHSASTGYHTSESQSSSRAKSLEVLNRLEVPARMDDEIVAARGFLPRHRLQLSPEKAQRFATTTGAWVDSGIMPETLQTGYQLPTIDNCASVSTGAMMEFLGNGLGGGLPFSNDALTSSIPLHNNIGDAGWMASEGVPLDDPTFMHELDGLIAATTDQPNQAAPAWDASLMFPGTNFADALGVTAHNFTPSGSALPELADNMDFDFGDMTFDAAFDTEMRDGFLT
ncbi:hypothetical protein LTR22_004997 [Elasticomyces elasticus]|nr:hypothetical protein LTR22_004997 [Elasticomyces elasticus]KAK4927603.1 hypothetical protein LTR49_005471 [Elasticomyces elasticus]KAK5766975.1 hypothetical protein LTS12_002739 [Elasticomyces elasticus]